MQAYSDPKRAGEKHALPDIEVWQDTLWIVTCPRCGDFDVHEGAAIEPSVQCPSCERAEGITKEPTYREAWFYWFCFPGCLPEGDPQGPFETEAEALADAQADAGDDESEG